MPCSEKRARLLLNRRLAVHSMAPFTIRLKYRTVEMSILQPIRCKIDPGSTITRLAIVREEKEQQAVLSLFELTHRGSGIRSALQSRRAKRRRRRFYLRYRSQRFFNRRKPKGWLAPSLEHRIEAILTWVGRFQQRLPMQAITCEKVRFDTQKLLDPEIDGVEYAKGTLSGYEVREYLLEKWGRKCAYCDAKSIPLQIDHIIPQSRGGTDRIGNLTLACSSCNRKKSSQTVEAFCPERAKTIRSKPSLRGAAAVNSTRLALFVRLTKLLIPCEEGTGGQTKYNRTRWGIPKTHALDAACTGAVALLQNWQIPTQQILSKGRGDYQRTRVDRFGFPRGYFLPHKRVDGFQTGGLVAAFAPSGKKQGHHAGRVAIRASGYFNIQTSDGIVQGISSKYCRLVQRADGYHYPKNLPAQNVQQKILQTGQRSIASSDSTRLSVSAMSIL